MVDRTKGTKVFFQCGSDGLVGMLTFKITVLRPSFAWPAAVTMTSIEHRPHLLAYVGFLISGITQLLITCGSLPATPMPTASSASSSSASASASESSAAARLIVRAPAMPRLVAFRLVSPAALLGAAVALAVAAYGTDAETVAHRLLAGVLCFAALAESVALLAAHRSPPASSQHSSSAPCERDAALASAATRGALGAHESATAVFAHAFFLLLAGAYFAWTTFTFYLN